MYYQPTKNARFPPNRGHYPRKALILITLLLIANTALLWLVFDTMMTQTGSRFPERLAAIWRVGIADIGERPHLTPRYPEKAVRYCSGTSENDRRAITEGIALLRATDAGSALYDVVEREGICIGVGELDFNSAFARSRWSPAVGWSESEIVIGSKYVDWLYPDIVAAILAHEATHIERAVDGTACYYANACTTLPNGVDLEEEIVAHQAEAEWWIAAYGRDGKDRAFTIDVSENRLKAAFLQGPEAFRTYVREMRSDEREGEGI